MSQPAEFINNFVKKYKIYILFFIICQRGVKWGFGKCKTFIMKPSLKRFAINKKIRFPSIVFKYISNISQKFKQKVLTMQKV